MKESLLIMISGAMGSLCRFGVGRGTKHLFNGTFPLDTLIVNVFGCLLIGFAMQLLGSGLRVSQSVHTAVTVGFLGAFTTFSTFGYATFDYIRQGEWGHAVLNSTANLVLGLLAVWIGMTGARMLASAS